MAGMKPTGRLALAQAKLRQSVERLEAVAEKAALAAARSKILDERLAKTEAERLKLAAELEKILARRTEVRVMARNLTSRLDRAITEVRSALGR